MAVLTVGMAFCVATKPHCFELIVLVDAVWVCCMHLPGNMGVLTVPLGPTILTSGLVVRRC